MMRRRNWRGGAARRLAAAAIGTFGLALPLAAGTISSITLGTSSSPVTFGAGTITFSSGLSGNSGTAYLEQLNWVINMSPSEGFNIGSGNTGFLTSSSSNEALTFGVNDGPDEDAIGGSIEGPDFFAAFPDTNGGEYLLATITVTSFTEGVLFLESPSLGYNYTSVTPNTTKLALLLDVDCGAEDPCISSVDPTGAVIGASLGPVASSPEPRMAVPLGVAMLLFLSPGRRRMASRFK